VEVLALKKYPRYQLWGRTHIVRRRLSMLTASNTAPTKTLSFGGGGFSGNRFHFDVFRKILGRMRLLEQRTVFAKMLRKAHG
jgi:hypothetical protein